VAIDSLWGALSGGKRSLATFEKLSMLVLQAQAKATTAPSAMYIKGLFRIARRCRSPWLMSA